MADQPLKFDLTAFGIDQKAITDLIAIFRQSQHADIQIYADLMWVEIHFNLRTELVKAGLWHALPALDEHVKNMLKQREEVVVK